MGFSVLFKSFGAASLQIHTCNFLRINAVPYTKFTQHHRKMLQDLYTDYERTKMVVVDPIFIDVSDLHGLYRDLDGLESICGAADDTYDEENEGYSDALEELKARFDALSINWLKEMPQDPSYLGDRSDELSKNKKPGPFYNA